MSLNRFKKFKIKTQGQNDIVSHRIPEYMINSYIGQALNMHWGNLGYQLNIMIVLLLG